MIDHTNNKNSSADKLVDQRIFLIAMSSALIAFLVLLLMNPLSGGHFLTIELSSSVGGTMQFFFDYGDGISESNSTRVRIIGSNSFRTYRVLLPDRRLQHLRLDPVDGQGDFALRNPRIVDADGATLRTLSLLHFRPLNDIALCDIADETLQLNCISSGSDPFLQIDGTSDWPLSASYTKYVSSIVIALTAITVIAIIIIAILAVGWVATTFGRRLAATPHATIVVTGAFVAIISCYPVVFLGRSLLSPGMQPALLYYGLPSVPGYLGDQLENTRGADVGAMSWAIQPISAIQNRAVGMGEFPLWNRYNSAGLPLLGQGQSMVLDPLHWITILGNGNGWAWDTKFVIARAIFVIGIGLAVFAATGNLAAALLMCTSSAYIGYFAFRVNHPAIFSLTYAPLILFFWFQVIQAFQGRKAGAATASIHGNDVKAVQPQLPPAEAKGSPWPAMIGLAVASVLHLAASTPKEGFMIFVVVHLTGGTAFVLSPGRIKEKLFPLACLGVLGLSIGLISAPVWLVFLDTLAQSRTMYDAPATVFAPFRYFAGIFESILFEQISGGSPTFPSLNIFMLICLLWALVQFRKLCQDPLFSACLAGTAVAAAMAFGLVPASIVLRLPLVANIHHIGQTFLTVFCVLAPVLAGFGVREFLDASDPERRRNNKIAGIALVLVVLFFYLNVAIDVAWISFAFVAGLITTAAIVPAWGAMASASRLLRTGKTKWLVVLGLFFGVMHLRHGLHPFTGLAALDERLLNVPSRADFSIPSPAVEALRRLPGPYRIIGETASLFPGFNALLGIESISSPDAVFSRYYVELLDALGIMPSNNWGWLRLVTLESLPRVGAGLDILNVRYVLAAAGTAPPPSLTVVGQADLDIWDRESAWPRAFFVNGEAHYQEVGELAQFAETAAGLPFAAVQVMESPTMRPESDRTVVPARSYVLTTNGTRFTVDASGPGMVVLMESFWPGDIHVTVNGLPGNAVRVNHAFRGVRVDMPGQFEIAFWYEPRYWRLSIAMAGLGLAMLVLGGWLSHRFWRPSAVTSKAL